MWVQWVLAEHTDALDQNILYNILSDLEISYLTCSFHRKPENSKFEQGIASMAGFTRTGHFVTPVAMQAVP
jgi:hypothetical protein